MGEEARAVFEEQYAGDRTLARLERIYDAAVRRRASA
jgi:hypothetical protein